MQKIENKNNFLIQGSILAITGILVRIIGLIYRIPLTRIVGEEGMGYYSTAYNVYAVVLLLSSYSLPLAVSKMVSARLAKNEYKNVKRVFLATMLYATLVGLAGFFITYFFAGELADIFFKLPLSKYALMALSPTVLVMAYLGVFRGYYQGFGTMVPTAVSQIIEQIINAIVSVLAAKYLMDMAIKEAKTASEIKAYSAAGGTIGTGAGAFFALLILFILIFIFNRKLGINKLNNESEKPETYKDITKVLFLTVIPVISSTAIYNINGIIDASIFGRSMYMLGEAAKTAGQYGVYTSKYLILINVPVAMANSISSSIIPELSRANSIGDRVKINKTIGLSMRVGLLISLPAFVGLTVLARPIITLLFGRSELAIGLMQIGAIAVVLYTISTISNAILQGTNNMSIPVKNAAISLVIHIIFLVVFLLIFRMGTYGLMLSNIVFALSMCILNARAIKNKIFYRQEIVRTYILPGICAIIMGIFAYLAYTLLRRVSTSNILLTLFPLLVAIIIYPIALILTKTVTEEEILLLPKGRKILLFLKRLRLI